MSSPDTGILFTWIPRSSWIEGVLCWHRLLPDLPLAIWPGKAGGNIDPNTLGLLKRMRKVILHGVLRDADSEGCGVLPSTAVEVWDADRGA